MKNYFSVLTIILMTVVLWSCSDKNDNTGKDAAIDGIRITVEAGNKIAPIQPTMYGIFFEDINFAADGGIYAELIKNRSFEFDDPLMGWRQSKSDRFSMNDNSGFASAINMEGDRPNAKYLRVTTRAASGYELVNYGFRGMGIKQGLDHHFTMDARVIEGSPTVYLELLDTANVVIAQASLELAGSKWQPYAATLTADRTFEKARFRMRFEGITVTDIDMVSLFPSDTWMGREKGLRQDLVQKLADLNPGFLRFPGGCIVEGRTLARRYQWKKTVGDIADRDLLINRWNTEFDHRLTPDYFQSFGLGFFEYFQLSEDLGAEPLPIIGCGMACQFNTGELVPMDQLGPYIDDALDLIEFANGPVDSEWGAVRASMGHPEPFNMKYIGIGNEQWGPQYIERYKAFESALKARHPEIVIISGSGPFPDGEMFEYGWEQLKKLNAEIIDEHYYRPPQWFLENADRYDSYDRNGPKVFAGEYAAQSVAIASPENKNNWECALSEAAYMTGLERNADLVVMTSYAPLFAHAEGWQWTPDLIWFNNLESYGTPNYYVQQLFSTNPGTHLIKAHQSGEPLTGQQGVYVSSVWDDVAGEVILKIVNASESSADIALAIEGVDSIEPTATLTTLSHSDTQSENSFVSPQEIFPQTSTVDLNPESPAFETRPLSLNILRIKVQPKS